MPSVPTGHCQVEVTDVEPAVMKVLLQFIYGKHLEELMPEEAPDLFSAAHRCVLIRLSALCLSFSPVNILLFDASL